MSENAIDIEIEKWKIDKHIESLQKEKGRNLITLILPPSYPSARMNLMLQQEIDGYCRRTSRGGRKDLLSCLVSAQHILKLYKEIPKNGLAILCGIIVTNDGREKKITLHFEPYFPLDMCLFISDNIFHTQVIKEELEKQKKVFKLGIIVINEKGVLIGRVYENKKEILANIKLNIPKKQSFSIYNQSFHQFNRMKNEKYLLFFDLISRLSSIYFLDQLKENINGLVIAGKSNLHNRFIESNLLHPSLKLLTIKVIDIQNGSENGFNHSIEQLKEEFTTQNVKLFQEMKIISTFFQEIVNETKGKCCFGTEKTLAALQRFEVDSLIISQSLTDIRFALQSTNGEEVIKVITAEEENKEEHFRYRGITSDIMQVINKTPLVDWLVDNYKHFNTSIYIVTENSTEGFQFKKTFGGIGGLLRSNANLEGENEAKIEETEEISDQETNDLADYLYD